MLAATGAAGGADGGLALLLIELGGIVVALAALSRIAARVGLSPIPLYLLAGLAFGEGGLLPLDLTEEFVEVGAEIGVLLLLYMLGLEYTASELQASLRDGWAAGVVDAVLNFTPGLLFGLLLGWEPIAAVLLGGVTYISSSGVCAKVLVDLERLGNRETPAVLSLLVMEDLVMAVYLPAIAVFLAATGLTTALVSLVAALVTVLVVFMLAARFGDPLSRAIFSHSDEAVLLTTFGLILLVAGIAQRLQVSAAIGAFLVGIALSGPVAERSRAVLSPLRDLFAAVFFVFFGLQVDPAAIPPVAGLAVALGVITAATKLATGWWAARRLGVGTRGRWRAGAVLVARGEFSIVIAGLGTAGVAPQLRPLAAAYVLFMVVLGPVTARAVEPVVDQIRRRSRWRMGV
ncbi:MAG TPA: cation:proton antiporter [Euzebyales bacterium]|nr:cation:proton antiporter [Euzebyales bacterium]